MNIFEKLIESQTGKKDLMIKEVYIKSAMWEWTYFIYYYDNTTHTFYINNLHDRKVYAINIIEHILNKAYKQEILSWYDAFNILNIKKKPKVFCIYPQILTKEIIIDQIKFKAVKDTQGNILRFKNPRWDKPLENTLKMLWLK